MSGAISDGETPSVRGLELVDKRGVSEVIETTNNHPFWVEGRGWTRVDQLHAGDQIPSGDGTTLVVASVYQTERVETVYNFGVDEFRSYFVGESGAWVHNCIQIPKGKWDYLFGRVKSGRHNSARSNQNALQMKRLGVPDSQVGRTMLQDHFKSTVKRPDSVVKSWSNDWGKFEVRESLFAGPSGKFSKFESTWEVMDDGTRRLTTVIPFGGQ